MILAMIDVIQCEDCHKVEILNDLASREAFESRWFNGLRYHFCPACRFTPRAGERIAEEAEIVERMVGARRALEYAN
ncbi:MAG: hypothetical protein IT174_10605 [Acidobacteria bacterium]|nr:hypothetical protein [Acidobacteriota bacterium]